MYNDSVFNDSLRHIELLRNAVNFTKSHYHTNRITLEKLYVQLASI